MRIFTNTLLALLVSTVCALVLLSPVWADSYPEEPAAPQEETLEARVTKVLEEKEIETVEGKRTYQKLELTVTKGSLKGENIVIENGEMVLANLQVYQVGDRVLVAYGQSSAGDAYFYITDYLRRTPLIWLFVVFIVLTAIIARWRGVTSLVGMAFSFLVIFKFILPKILGGSDPVLIAILGSLLIIPLTFYLSHGFGKKTTIAVIGTSIALIITGLSANIAIEAAKLTGFASEEAGFLQVYQSGQINMKGLLLAGIIIGTLGILDDITVSQSAIVAQLKKSNPRLGRGELFKRAMDVGQDHISSMVNTLVLIYAGASLPLLLLFINTNYSFSEVINYEILADEVVRTLVGSIGLILAVPITTLIASLSVGER